MMGMSSPWTLLNSRYWSSWISRTASSDSLFWSVLFLSRSELICRAASSVRVSRWVLSLVSSGLDLVVELGEVGLALLVPVLELGDDPLAFRGLLEDHLGIDDADLPRLLGEARRDEGQDEDGQDQKMNGAS